MFVCGKEAAFTKQEFDFLQLLLTHISKVITYEHICEIVWGNEYEKQNSNALWCLASKVRKKISALGGAAGIIQTVRFVGYRIEKMRHRSEVRDRKQCDMQNQAAFFV